MSGRERIAIISPDTSLKIILNLKKNHIRPVIIPKTTLVEKAISGHPDIQIFIYNKKLFCHADISLNFLKEIEKYIEIIICETKLESNYPHDIPYNIAANKFMAIHNFKYSADEIKVYLQLENIPLVDVEQGYSRCSTLLVNNGLITSDPSIYRECLKNKIDVLKIRKGYIKLPGYNYGFIGGCTGELDGKIYFTGNIKMHPDFTEIEKFIFDSNLEIEILSKGELIDLGSVLFI
jgi:uncharacterized protein DUF6873